MTEVMQTQWPKKIPNLSQAQIEAREKWMTLWHEELPNKYGMVEDFNHGFPSRLPLTNGPLKTLEIGAGLGEHIKWEKTENQKYYMLEYRQEWCERLKKSHPQFDIVHGDIQKKLDFESGFFDRAIAIHVLEHLPDLPKALIEIDRLLKPGAIFDIVLPCEGGLAYEVARKISSERMFKKHFGMEYKPIIQAKHLNTYPEIQEELKKMGWELVTVSYFPLKIPIWSMNVCVGQRWKKK